MYTQTMNVEEIIKEFNSDLPQVVAISDAKQSKVDKIVRKSAHYPVYLHSFVKTKRGNDWLILFEAKSKKNVGMNCLMTLVSIMNMKDGRYAIMWSTVFGRTQFIMFTPHFFSRFAQRVGIELTGMELIQRYFKINASYGFNKRKEIVGEMMKTNIYGSTVEGVALGVQLYTESNVILFRTFITYEMTKGEQIEAFAQAEEIRREMHEETISIKQ